MREPAQCVPLIPPSAPFSPDAGAKGMSPGGVGLGFGPIRRRTQRRKDAKKIARFETLYEASRRSDAENRFHSHGNRWPHVLITIRPWPMAWLVLLCCRKLPCPFSLFAPLRLCVGHDSCVVVHEMNIIRNERWSVASWKCLWRQRDGGKLNACRASWGNERILVPSTNNAIDRRARSPRSA